MGKRLGADVIKSKQIETSKGYETVNLRLHNGVYTVECGKEVYYKGSNQMFAMQKFNEI